MIIIVSILVDISYPIVCHSHTIVNVFHFRITINRLRIFNFLLYSSRWDPRSRMENGNGTSGADGGAAHISPYCGDMLVDMHDVYVHYHGYASLLVCAFGSVANVLNIAVLTRKEMVSPTNAILTGLAVADLLVMVEYVPFAYHMYLRPTNYPRADRFSYNWSLFVLLHSDFSQAFHTISIWLTVTLAVWR